MIINAEAITDLDTTGVAILERLLDDLRDAGVDLSFARVRSPVRAMMARTGFEAKLGAERFHLEVDDAPALPGRTTRRRSFVPLEPPMGEDVPGGPIRPRVPRVEAPRALPQLPGVRRRRQAPARRRRDGRRLRRWTRHFAEPKPIEERDTQSVLVFRVGPEWLALASACVAEVAALLPDSLAAAPAEGVVLGVASVRGELLICVSLGCLLGIESPAGVDRTAHRARTGGCS